MRILIAGGGTGGHIYPGISVANHFRDLGEGHEIRFVGTKRGMEADLIPKAGYSLELITVSGFQRRLSFGLFKSFADVFHGFGQARKLIRRFQPDIVIGTGGYVCGPVVAVARMAKIPTLILEQNVIPGVTNRILGRFVDGVAVTYEASRGYFPHHQDVRVTGNPIRNEIMMADRTIGRQTLGIRDDQFVIMGFGGSIGAQRINDAMIELCVHFHNSKKVHILHITGRDKYESVIAELASRGIVLPEAGNINIKPYLYNIQDAYGASDLIVSRAGGISLSELTAIGKPAIIVPYPHATNQHQDHNGRFLAHEGAAVLITDQELSGERLIYHVDALMNDPTALKQMADNSRRIGRPQAAEEIADFVRELIRKRQSSHHGRSGLSNAGRD